MHRGRAGLWLMPPPPRYSGPLIFGPLDRRRYSAAAARAGVKAGITSRAKARRLATEALGSTGRMLMAQGGFAFYPISDCFSS